MIDHELGHVDLPSRVPPGDHRRVPDALTFLAVCRSCAGEQEHACPVCHGEAVTTTRNEAEADIVIRFTATASGLSQTITETPRFLAWKAGVSR